MQPLISPGGGAIPGVPLQQPTNLFRYGEITLFSTFCFPGSTALASTSNPVFSTAIGGQGQGWPAGIALTLAETNLKTPGQVPQGQAYDVYGVAGQVYAGAATPGTMALPFNDATATVATLVNVINNSVLRWDFTQTTVDICPLSLAGAGGGAYGAIAQNAAGANSGAMNNGNGGIWMYRKHPVALPGSTAFRVNIDFGGRAAAIPAGFSVAIRVVLLGFYKSVIEIGA